ncbi:MAG: adenosylcobinamide-GDP ribazoletransferase, partial [Candidatus Omnitrophica bacterium]|nr:adenosylcobinamide-GDP ribazoletransferase [Candidatus Omnitrophota bacterium]
SNFKYAREEGKAKEYFQGANNRIFVQATLVTLCIVLFTLFLKGLFIFVAVALVSYLINKYISSKINGVTGDTIGAVSECIEVVTLFCICIIGRSG